MGFQEKLNTYRRKHKWSHMLKVEGFSTLLKHNIEECPSSTFELFGFKWMLKLKPRNRDGHISLYLKISFSNVHSERRLNNHVDFVLFLWSQDDGSRHKFKYTDVCFNMIEDEHGEDDFISHEDFLDQEYWGYLVNDSAIFGVEITKFNQQNSILMPRVKGTYERVRFIENPQSNKFTWKITKFSSFNEGTHFSNAFAIGQRKWTIKMFRRGNSEKDRLRVYLEVLDYVGNVPKAETLAKFKLSVLDQLSRDHREHEATELFGPEPGEQSTDFVSVSLKTLHDQSKGFLVNDVIYLGVEFKLLSITEYLW